MVKFGRHVDFFVANSSHELYVVPYTDMREKYIEIHPANQLPPHPPATVTSAHDVPDTTPGISNISSGQVSRVSSRVQTSQPRQKQPTQQQQQQPISTSELSALFDNSNLASPIIKPNCTPFDAIVDDAILSPVTTIHKKAANSLNATTGEELAVSVRLMTKQRKILSAAIPGCYGHGDPCSDGDADDGRISEEREEDGEAQAHFLAQRFKTEWRIGLKRAAVDFDRAMQLFWSEVFEGISSGDQSNQSITMNEGKAGANKFKDAIRGALPDAALQMYVSVVPPERAQEAFSFLKDIHSTALINAEALRKLVKKFDKLHRKNSSLLSIILLPEVYVSNFTGSLASLEAGLTLLRVLLNIEEGDDCNGSPTSPEGNRTQKKDRVEKRRIRRLGTLDDDMRDLVILSGGYFGNNQDIDAGLVHRRKEELQWLRDMILGIDPVYIPFLVSHRGFHSVNDHSDVRPLENSLTAYEAAWTNGLHLCECDIALTKDERIILAHDENFVRLGMDPTSPLCNRTVRDLTFKELMNCPLKCGARPPLLFDVLRSAAAIGGDAKMIVEIKPGNTEASSALARMFLRHPQLIEYVAAVMSFDVFIMHNLRREMAAVYEQLNITKQQQQQHGIVAPTARAAPPSSAAISIVNDNTESNAHPLKVPILSDIALGSTLSTSPLPTLGISHNRPSPQHVRVPPGLGGQNRQDLRDKFELGHRLMDPISNAYLGSDLAYQSSTFLHIHKSPLELLPLDNEEKLPDGIFPSDSSPDITDDNQMNYPIKNFPKLLLITVAEAPREEYELSVDITKPDKVAMLDGWMQGADGGTLDGVYMQYQKLMIGPEGSKAMRNLSSKYNVGIWGANPVPDDWDTFHTLVTECHVSYVNTSLSKHFRRKMKRSLSANTVAMNGMLRTNINDPLS